MLIPSVVSCVHFLSQHHTSRALNRIFISKAYSYISPLKSCHYVAIKFSRYIINIVLNFSLQHFLKSVLKLCLENLTVDFCLQHLQINSKVHKFWFKVSYNISTIFITNNMSIKYKIFEISCQSCITVQIEKSSSTWGSLFYCQSPVDLLESVGNINYETNQLDVCIIPRWTSERNLLSQSFCHFSNDFKSPCNLVQPSGVCIAVTSNMQVQNVQTPWTLSTIRYKEFV
jgi:hypothetical protein